MEKSTLLYAETYNLKNNMRYLLSHKLMNELFMKWMAQPQNTKIVKNLIEDCKKSNISFSTPNPLFLSKHHSLSQSQAVHSFMPPMSPNSMSQNYFSSQKSAINFLSEPRKDEKISKDSRTFFKHIHAINYDIIEKGRLTKSDPFRKIEEPSLVSKSKVIIPQFYYPDGRNNNEQNEKDEKLISKIFENTDEITNEEDFLQISLDILGFPKMFSGLLFKRIDIDQRGIISKNNFLKVFKENFQGKSQMRRFFNFIKLGYKEDHLARSHFMPFIRTLLELHPGLEFLKSHPDFQDKYADTVIMRIYYSCDLNCDDKITFREFKKSNIMSMFYKVCEEPDINKVREYFSYEHFYVLYCKFWELDTNEHDFLINKDDFIKYDGHSLSRKAVDRIFQQIPKKFKSGLPDIMNFEDFVWFMLSEEDKTTRTSIEYWFKVVDLDNNGIITPHEMNYFYEEQLHRLEYLGNESVNFNDMVCQLTDMLKPEKDFQFTIDNFLNNRQYSSVFFNSLLNLNKFLAFEQRDPFSRTEIDKNPEYTDWDKYAYYEYNKLTMEESQEQEQENSEIFDSNPGNQGSNNPGGDNLDISVESINNNDDDI